MSTIESNDGNPYPFRPSWDYDHCLTRLDAMTPAPIPWLWPGRIPLAKISLLVSRPGVGKSPLAADLASPALLVVGEVVSLAELLDAAPFAGAVSA